MLCTAKLLHAMHENALCCAMCHVVRTYRLREGRAEREKVKEELYIISHMVGNDIHACISAFCFVWQMEAVRHSSRKQSRGDTEQRRLDMLCTCM